VDGNDVFAVYTEIDKALKRARSGEGASLVEAFTYRLGDHTTADDAKKYRSEEEVQEWEAKSPIMRLDRFMRSRDMWDDKHEEELITEIDAYINEELATRESMDPQDPLDMFRYMYKEIPPHLHEQMHELAAEVEK